MPEIYCAECGCEIRVEDEIGLRYKDEIYWCHRKGKPVYKYVERYLCVGCVESAERDFQKSIENGEFDADISFDELTRKEIKDDSSTIYSHWDVPDIHV